LQPTELTKSAKAKLDLDAVCLRKTERLFMCCTMPYVAFFTPLSFKEIVR